jgi:ATP-binding cassette, subfamily B, multidrug efflux pump
MSKNTVKQDEEIKVHSNLEILARLAKYLKPFKLKVFIVLLLMIFVMICGILNPYLLKIAIDENIAKSDIKGLVIIGLTMLVLYCLAALAAKIRMVMMSSVTNTILVDIRDELYGHIQKLTFSFFDNRPVGKVLARVIGDVNALQEFFTNSITSLIPETLSLVFVTLMMFSMNYKLAICAMIILPLLAASMFMIETLSRKRWQAFRKKRSNLNAFTHEDFSGIRIVQAFANEDNSSQTFSTLVKEMMGSFIRAVKLNNLFWPMVEVSWGIGSIVVFWYAVRLTSTESVSVGTIIAFTSYVGMFWRPIMNISNFYNTLITNFAAADRIFEILDIKPDIVDGKDTLKMPKIKGNVEFKDVLFYYEEGTPVLDYVSFKVNAGETIALVGPTGAGKTTIVNLVSRFYDAQKGEVLIDGKCVKDVELESLRSQMGIMLQDTFLFSASIKENIRYGKLDATDEEVIAAAKAVSAHEFIMKLPHGYDTDVNERGSRLSVGQRQLISFARALLANPRILILDEATSNIDTATERLVQKGIQKLLYGRTSFVIAHRLSTIRDCDRIMVIDNGQIAESGSHEELMALKGLYYDLYMSQYKFLNEGA